MRARLLPHPGLTILLTLFWVLLLNSVSVTALVAGVAVAIVVPIFTAPFWPGTPRLRFGTALLGYLALVLRDIVVANLGVARIILTRADRDLRPGWIVVPVELDSAEAVSVLAGTISLTPGTVTADVSTDGRSLLVHMLDLTDDAAAVERIRSRYEARLRRIFQ